MCEETGGCRTGALLLAGAGNFRGVCPMLNRANERTQEFLHIPRFRFRTVMLAALNPASFRRTRKHPGECKSKTP